MAPQGILEAPSGIVPLGIGNCIGQTTLVYLNHRYDPLGIDSRVTINALGLQKYSTYNLYVFA